MFGNKTEKTEEKKGWKQVGMRVSRAVAVSIAWMIALGMLSGDVGTSICSAGVIGYICFLWNS